MNAKRLIVIPTLALTLMGALAGCAGSDGGGSGEKERITVWTFSTELKEIAKKYYNNNANVIVKSTVTQVRSDLNNAIRSKKGIPDVVALEAAVIADFTSKTSEEAVLLPLEDITGTEDMYTYTKSVATTTDGKVLGLSWQATPGGFFYKQSVAEKVGITTPQQMEEKISTWEGYLDLAKTCREYDLDPNKDGTQAIAVCSSITDPIKVFLSGRDKAWVIDNTLQLEPIMFGTKGVTPNCFDTVRELQQKEYTHESSDRGPGWISDIDTNNTLGYFCSSWGLNFDLMPNASLTVGDWRMCKAPIDYFRGGTWLAIPKLASNVEKAKEFIKFITTNKEFLKERGLETGDFMNSKSVMSEIVEDYHCEFLGGQNHLKILLEVADNINGELISPYDAAIDSVFTTTVANYARDVAETPEELEEAREDQISRFITGLSKYSFIIPEEDE